MKFDLICETLAAKTLGRKPGLFVECMNDELLSKGYLEKGALYEVVQHIGFYLLLKSNKRQVLLNARRFRKPLLVT